MGREVIKDNELDALSTLIAYQIDVSADFQDSPNVEFWTRRHESVKRVIEARKN